MSYNSPRVDVQTWVAAPHAAAVGLNQQPPQQRLSSSGHLPRTQPPGYLQPSQPVLVNNSQTDQPVFLSPSSLGEWSNSSSSSTGIYTAKPHASQQTLVPTPPPAEIFQPTVDSTPLSAPQPPRTAASIFPPVCNDRPSLTESAQAATEADAQAAAAGQAVAQAAAQVAAAQQALLEAEAFRAEKRWTAWIAEEKLEAQRQHQERMDMQAQCHQGGAYPQQPDVAHLTAQMQQLRIQHEASAVQIRDLQRKDKRQENLILHLEQRLNLMTSYNGAGVAGNAGAEQVGYGGGGPGGARAAGVAGQMGAIGGGDGVGTWELTGTPATSNDQPPLPINQQQSTNQQSPLPSYLPPQPPTHDCPTRAEYAEIGHALTTIGPHRLPHLPSLPLADPTNVQSFHNLQKAMQDAVRMVRALAKDTAEDAWHPEWITPIKLKVVAVIKDGSSDATKLHTAVDLMFDEARRKGAAGMEGPEVFRQLMADMAKKLLEVDLMQVALCLGSFAVAEGSYLKDWMQLFKSTVDCLTFLGDRYTPRLPFIVRAVGANLNRQFGEIYAGLPCVFDRSYCSLDEFWEKLSHLHTSNARATATHNLPCLRFRP